MEKDFEIVNVISTTNEERLKEKINSIVRTICLSDIEKMMNIDYNIGVAYLGGTSDFNEKEVSEEC